MADTEEKKNKPEDSDFKQQRLKAWQPILTPPWVIATFATVGIIFLIIGCLVLDASGKVVEYSTGDYSGSTPSSGTYSCANGPGYNTDPKSCMVSQTVTIEKDMVQPIYFYYQLENFYQNHRRYVKSRSDTQLRGDTLTETTNCSPQATRDGKTIYPCGLIAWSVFNDTFYSGATNYSDLGVSITPGATRDGLTKDTATTIPWTGKGIAWASDVDEKFTQLSTSNMDSSNLVLPYDGYKYFTCKNTPAPSTQCLATAASNNGCNPEGSTCASSDRFADVSNQEFIVWMRTSGLPTFRKLHRIIKTDLKAGDVLTFHINNVFPVSGFSGKKKLVLSTTTWIGGQNDFLGWAYIVVAIICLLLAMGFGIKQIVDPREVAAASKLTTAVAHPDN